MSKKTKIAFDPETKTVFEVLTKDEYIERANKIHNNQYDYSKLEEMDYFIPIDENSSKELKAIAEEIIANEGE